MGTTSLMRLFKKAGYKSTKNRDIKLQINSNMREGKDPFHNIDQDCFWDMELHQEGIYIYEKFEYIYQYHSTALYIINIRNLTSWLNSRLRHRDGAYLRIEMSNRGFDSEDQVLQFWTTYYYNHYAKVFEFFSGKENFVIFDLDNLDILKLNKFFQPDFNVDFHKLEIHNQNA